MDECTWQPIETIPKDGTLILIKDDLGIYLAEWRRENYVVGTSKYYTWVVQYTYGDEQGGEMTVDSPTAWFPLSSIKEK